MQMFIPLEQLRKLQQKQKAERKREDLEREQEKRTPSIRPSPKPKTKLGKNEYSSAAPVRPRDSTNTLAKQRQGVDPRFIGEALRDARLAEVADHYGFVSDMRKREELIVKKALKSKRKQKLLSKGEQEALHTKMQRMASEKNLIKKAAKQRQETLKRFKKNR